MIRVMPRRIAATVTAMKPGAKLPPSIGDPDTALLCLGPEVSVEDFDIIGTEGYDLLVDEFQDA